MASVLVLLYYYSFLRDEVMYIVLLFSLPHSSFTTLFTIPYKAPRSGFLSLSFTTRFVAGYTLQRRKIDALGLD